MGDYWAGDAGLRADNPVGCRLTIVEELLPKRLCFSVTSGRSGTKLLTTLLRDAAGLFAEHEPAPRFNYVLRSVLECPEAARWWLLNEKLPAVANTMGPADVYAELSHLTCKAFIEPLLELSLRPRFVILSRPAREVASSLFRINAIPERTGSGRLVLIGPQHSPFLPLTAWDHLTDYQLCYWYAREIEHRQAHYRSLFNVRGIEFLDCAFAELNDWDEFVSIATFVRGEAVEPDRTAFNAVISCNQNARAVLLDGSRERVLPEDIASEEAGVDELIAAVLLAGGE